MAAGDAPGLGDAGGRLGLVAWYFLQQRFAPISGPASAAVCLWALRALTLAALSGWPPAQAEFFGLAPDPTAIATLGVLLGTGADRAWARVLLAGLWLLLPAR